MWRTGFRIAFRVWLGIGLVAFGLLCNWWVRGRYGLFIDDDIRYFESHCPAFRGRMIPRDHVLVDIGLFGYLGGIIYYYDPPPEQRFWPGSELGWRRELTFWCLPLIGCLTPPELSCLP